MVLILEALTDKLLLITLRCWFMIWYDIFAIWYDRIFTTLLRYFYLFNVQYCWQKNVFKGDLLWHLENILKIALIYFEPSTISMTLKTHSLSKIRKFNVPCLGDYDDNEPLLFWWVFSLAGFCHKSEKVSRKKANIEAENSLRDRSYCWRVISDQVRVNNIVFAIVGNIGIVFLGGNR